MEVRTRLIIVGIFCILAVTVLFWLVYNNEVTNVEHEGFCLTQEEIEANCNELCTSVESDFCSYTEFLCDGLKVSCLDLNIDCPYINCSEPLIEE